MSTATIEDVEQQLESAWGEKRGLVAWVKTVDHKRIGVRYMVTAFIFFLLAGIEALIIRAQLSGANRHLVSPDTYNQIFTMHGTTMIFLFSTPILFGFGNYFVPLLIGARDMAFPRLNAFGYWVFLFAGTFMWMSVLFHQAPNDGWTNYVTLSGKDYSPGVNIDYYSLGLIFLGLSTTAGAINFIVTILKMRCPGMSLNRLPLFCWAILSTSFTVIFAIPALTAANLLLEMDRRFGYHFYTAGNGGDPVLWQHLFWIFGHPDVYIIFLPAVGLVSTLIPVFSQHRMVGYIYVALAAVATGIISFGVWVHHMFAVGLPSLSMSYFSAASLLITIPSGVQMIAWLCTLVQGRVRMSSPMYFVAGFIALFMIGGVTGVMFAVVPFDQQVTDSYFVVAHFHYVLFGGMVFPVFGAFHYWLPKITGRMLDEFWAKTTFWLMFVGFNLTFFPMHILGLNGMPRRIYTYQAVDGWEQTNALASVGSTILSAGILIFILNTLWSRKYGQEAGNNPWNADSLEWAVSSPPPEYNFPRLPKVQSAYPMWNEIDPVDTDVSMTQGKETLGTTLTDAIPDERLRMPEPSAKPFSMALGLFVLFVGLLVDRWIITAIGVVWTLASLAAWQWRTLLIVPPAEGAPS